MGANYYIFYFVFVIAATLVNQVKLKTTNSGIHRDNIITNFIYVFFSDICYVQYLLNNF